jgi:hypothetical protein
MPLTATTDVSLNYKWDEYKKALLVKLRCPPGQENPAFREFKALFPSVLWVPNVAQERIFGIWREEPYPFISLITFGNGAGKTDALGEFLCAVAKGNMFVNPVFCRGKYFDELDEKRKAGKLVIWWVCDAELMKQGSPDYNSIKDHIPDAIFKGKDNKNVYHEVHIPTMGENGTEVVNVVQVKTHGQDTTSYAGANVDLIICDEPPPEQHWAEIIGRTRSKKGEAGSRVVIGGTPLKIAGFLMDVVVDKALDGVVSHLTGSLWENCAGDEIPAAEADKRGVPFDPVREVYLTRGVLSRESIQRQISLWEKSSDPMEMAARVDGAFAHVMGRIYKIYRSNVHVIPMFKTLPDYPILQYVDPHDARPDAAIWVMVTPKDRLIVVMEDPRETYENLFSRQLDIEQTCDRWRSIEAEFPTAVVRRYGDPNKFSDPDPNTKKRLYELYRQHGFIFNLNVTDSLSIGHARVREFLWYDEEWWKRDPNNVMNRPRLLIGDNCVNCDNQMRQYSTVVPKDLSQAFRETVSEKHKDFPDIIRYACVTFKPYIYLKGLMTGSGSDEWDRVKAGRQPVKEIKVKRRIK